MAKLLITCVLLFAAMLPASAATPENNPREEYARKRALLFADRLGLDDATTEKFVKLFVQNQREKWTIQPEGKSRNKKSYKTDAQIDSAINAQFKNSQKILDMRKKYYKEYRKLLSAKQVQMLYDEESKMNVRMRGINNEMRRKKASMSRKKAAMERKKARMERKKVSRNKTIQTENKSSNNQKAK